MDFKKLIYDTFTLSKNELEFSQKFSNAIYLYFISLKGSTYDEGVIIDGDFKGNGKIKSIQCDESILSDIFYSTSLNLKDIHIGGNLLLSTCIGNALKSFCEKSIILCEVNGECVSPEGKVSIVNGESKGNLSIDTEELIVYMNSLFNEFNYRNKESIKDYNERLNIGTIYKDSNECLSYRLSNLIQNSLSKGNLQTNGLLQLVGSIGNGKLIVE